MKRQFKTIEKLIEAEKFIYKKIHPSIGKSEPEQIPEGVYKKRFEDYQDDAPYYKWGVDTEKGFMRIEDGDYLVITESGKKKVIPSKEFKKKYELVSN